MEANFIPFTPRNIEGFEYNPNVAKRQVNILNLENMYIQGDPNQNLKFDLAITLKIQGDPNQNLKFVLAITPKICISDPMLVKPKCIWGLSVFLKKL